MLDQGLLIFHASITIQKDTEFIYNLLMYVNNYIYSNNCFPKMHKKVMLNYLIP